MTHYRAILLDAGGTLIHLDRAFILGALAEQGIQKDEAAFLNADLAARAQRAAALRNRLVKDDAGSWPIYAAHLLEMLEARDEVAAFVAERMKHRHLAGTLWSFVEPGTIETLVQLKQRGLKLGVVSNSDGRVENFLRLAGLTTHLDFVIDSAVVGIEKPAPGIFEVALQRAGVSAAEALHVGDVYEIDVLGARAAGIEPVLLVANGGLAPDGVRVIKTLPELLDELD